jgi:hypothetical protein
LKILLLPLFSGIYNYAYGQVVNPADSLKANPLPAKTKKVQKPADTLSKQFDIGDLFQAAFHPNKKPDSVIKKSSGITIIPNVASNPSIGSQIGIKAVAGRKLGNDPNTLLSVAATSASITTKGIIYFYVNHNIYTPGNKWNFQGNLVVAKTVTPDFGLGIGQGSDASEDDHTLTNPYILTSGKRHTRKWRKIFLLAADYHLM